MRQFNYPKSFLLTLLFTLFSEPLKAYSSAGDAELFIGLVLGFALIVFVIALPIGYLVTRNMEPRPSFSEVLKKAGVFAFLMVLLVLAYVLFAMG
ncbi:MAG: hypothetical protein IT236_16755 [Bacteroidia bacterium]|nr:hypothetical protein [Bacteroidia bacterium]